MATGIQSSNSRRVQVVRLVESATAANGAPTGAPSATPAAATGFDLAELGAGYLLPEDCTVRLYSTAGSGTMTLTYARAWGYSILSGLWTPLGTGADTDKGKLNAGASFGETGTDTLRHQEVLTFPNHLDGIYIELGTFGGTSTAISVEIDFPRHVRI